MIAAVLVIPTPAGAALIAEGTCGSRPPIAWLEPNGRGENRWKAGQGPNPVGGIGWSRARALVLAWSGQVVPEGRNRAAEVLAKHEGRDPTRYATWWRNDLGLYDDDGNPTGRVVRWCLNCGDGSVWYGSAEAEGMVHHVVPALDDEPEAETALATVLVARGLASRVILLDEAGAEVQP